MRKVYVVSTVIELNDGSNMHEMKSVEASSQEEAIGIVAREVMFDRFGQKISSMLVEGPMIKDVQDIPTSHKKP